MTCQIKHLSEEVCPNTIIFSTSIDAWTPAQAAKINFENNSMLVFHMNWSLKTADLNSHPVDARKFIHILKHKKSRLKRSCQKLNDKNISSLNTDNISYWERGRLNIILIFMKLSFIY